MKHNQGDVDFRFVKEPREFDKYIEREGLQYCLGALLYMPATKDFAQAILSKKYPELTSIAMCFEDACEDERVEEAEQNVLCLLDTLAEAVRDGVLPRSDVPIIFFRVRSIEQFKHFSLQLTIERVQLIAGFIFPKFNFLNGREYLEHLNALKECFSSPLYGMPILEDSVIAFEETRIGALLDTKALLDRYKDLVLNVRVGCTDFSSCFGVRRSMDQTVYDLLTVRDCLTSILNVFSRNNDYVVSGPVWEYFPRGLSEEKDLAILHGLEKEVALDKSNGFIGKTCIHPSQVRRVNRLYAVTESEFADARQILGMSSGVAKGSNGMNEAKPHRKWAERIVSRASAYGVIEDV